MAQEMTSDRFLGPFTDPTPLGEPLDFAFSGKAAPNRFLKGAMTERMATWTPGSPVSEQGIPTPELAALYSRWGAGGFGLIVTGNIMIDPRRLEAPGNMTVPESAMSEPGDARFDGFRALAAAAKADCSSIVVAQVSQPGREAGDERDVMAPQEIGQLAAGFARAAEYLYKAGFDGIQLHAAYGSLLSEYISHGNPSAIFTITSAIRSQIAALFSSPTSAGSTAAGFIISLKINGGDFASPDACRGFLASLDAQGIDFVEISGGSRACEAIMSTTPPPSIGRTRVFVTGGLRTVDAMVRVIAEHPPVHGVGLGRPAAFEPDLPCAILGGRVTSGVLRPKLEGEELLAAAGAAVKMMALGREPLLDPTRNDHVAVFRRAYERFKRGVAEAGVDGGKCGYVDVDVGEGLMVPQYSVSSL